MKDEEKNDHFWFDKSEQTLFRTPVFDLKSVRRSNQKGLESEFTVLDAPSWVTIIPYMAERDSFLLVKQFRHGSGRLSLEFPAGAVDKGESFLNAAKRELLEETGYQAMSWICIGSVNPNPAFFNNRCETYLATGLFHSSSPRWDETESMDILELAKEDLYNHVDNGEMDNAIMIQALYWLGRYNKQGVE